MYNHDLLYFQVCNIKYLHRNFIEIASDSIEVMNKFEWKIFVNLGKYQMTLQQQKSLLLFFSDW